MPLLCVGCGYDLSGVGLSPLGACKCPECGLDGAIAEIGRAPRPAWPSRRWLATRWIGVPLGIALMSWPLAFAGWGAAVSVLTLAASVGVVLPMIMAPDMGLLHWGSRTRGVLLAAAVVAGNLSLLVVVALVARAIAFAMR